MAGAGHYTKKGLYNNYDKKHKERDKFDYYSTPPNEVLNILHTYKPDFTGDIILEPCAGEGHMASAIWKYIKENNFNNSTLICTEFQERENKFKNEINIVYGEEFDFLSDDYLIPEDRIDWIIMNPPYATIEPFMIRALDIAQKGVIMLGRIQILEGQGRFENVFQKHTPTDIYVYVDRIQCWKNGEKPTSSSSQGYCWVIWDKTLKRNSNNNEPKLHWLRRSDKNNEYITK